MCEKPGGCVGWSRRPEQGGTPAALPHHEGAEEASGAILLEDLRTANGESVPEAEWANVPGAAVLLSQEWDRHATTSGAKWTPSWGRSAPPGCTGVSEPHIVCALRYARPTRERLRLECRRSRHFRGQGVRKFGNTPNW